MLYVHSSTASCDKIFSEITYFSPLGICVRDLSLSKETIKIKKDNKTNIGIIPAIYSDTILSLKFNVYVDI